MAKLLPALAVAIVLAGCGSSGGGGGSSTPTASPTTASVIPRRPRLEPQAVQKMAAFPFGSGGTIPDAASTKVHDPGQLHAAYASAESLWEREFASVDMRYQHAKLAFFHSTVRTPCGEQSRETGPFYCPPVHGVYLNTHFFDALARAYGLRSGYAAGYITAHEVGHHVQQLLGTLPAVRAADQSDPAGTNARSVQTELQADCYAGVWLHSVSAAGQLTEADVNDILRAATVVGDDFQRNQANAELAPETWTHGSSAQRKHWVLVGLREGRPAACDTFGSG